MLVSLADERPPQPPELVRVQGSDRHGRHAPPDGHGLRARGRVPLDREHVGEPPVRPHPGTLRIAGIAVDACRPRDDGHHDVPTRHRPAPSKSKGMRI